MQAIVAIPDAAVQHLIIATEKSSTARHKQRLRSV